MEVIMWIIVGPILTTMGLVPIMMVWDWIDNQN